LSWVTIERDGEQIPDPDSASETYFIARILLGILQRGRVSVISPRAERAILDRSGRFYSLHQDDNNVSEMLCMDAERSSAFLDALCASHLAADPRTTPDWSSEEDSFSERRCFNGPLRDLFGAGLSLVEAQRPLESMLDMERVESKAFVGQRVDFALETPSGTKIVFEVDGPRHDRPLQKELDQRRDAALRRSKWFIERIPVDRLDQAASPFSPELIQRIERDPLLSELRHASLPELDALATEAARLVLTPHAVARVQLAILLAMIEGTLRLDADCWSIGVIERDLPCAELAVADLLEQMRHLCCLYGIAFDVHIDLHVLPDFELSVTEPTIEPDPAVWTRTETAESFSHAVADLDLLIDVSVRTRPMDRFPARDEELWWCDLAKRAFVVRTAYRPGPEVFHAWPSPRAVERPEEKGDALTYFLQTVFRKKKFRSKQLDVIERALQRKSVIGLLPTGGGKSITFQLPTMLSPGVAFVVAPLRSLIDDQEDNLHRAGINRVVGLHGGKDAKVKAKLLKEIVKGYPRFIYVAPERFQIREFRSELATSPITKSVAFVVVDEAHCVSEWGHDFRPAYLNVSKQARRIFGRGTGEVPILALTGIASTTVLIDIQRELEFDPTDDESIVSVESFDRDNLHFIPVPAPPGEKSEHLKGSLGLIAEKLGVTAETLVNDAKKGGIVFCRYVNGEFGVSGVSSKLRQQLGSDDSRIRIFSGAKPRQFSGTREAWDEYKHGVQLGFKQDQFPFLVATSSFGMGIDKENIRYTVHYGIPPCRSRHSPKRRAVPAGMASCRRDVLWSSPTKSLRLRRTIWTGQSMRRSPSRGTSPSVVVTRAMPPG
jgi:ATP-dependent DNA helicase RecQ